MFDRLMASRNCITDRSRVPSSTVAALTHAGVCAAAVLGTLRPHRVSRAEGPPIIISWPQPQEDGSHADPLDRIAGPTAAPIDVPTQAPIGLPRSTQAYPSTQCCCCVAPATHQVTVAWTGRPMVCGAPRQWTIRRRSSPVRAEPRSLMLESSHAGFDAAARAYVLGAVFRPGRTHGRAVRVLVRLPIGFTLRPTR